MKPMWLLFTVIFFSMNNVILGYNQQRSIRNKCPVQEAIPKCDCETDNRGLVVTCKHFEADADLQDHLTNLQGYFLRSLKIENFSASSISTDLWRGQEIEDLSLERVEVDDASFRRGQRHFQGLEKSLEALHVTNSFAGHRPLLNLQLDHLENLKYIIMEQNSIPEVGNDWFASGPTKLTTLIFEKNGIEELGGSAFSSLNNLRLLAVAGNHIHTISRSMLPKQATVLTHLDLSYNKIRTLPKDIFSNLPALQQLHLDYNLLHVIEEDVWGPIASRLESLRLEGNVIVCDESLKWLCNSRVKSIYGKCSQPLEKKDLTISQFCKM